MTTQTPLILIVEDDAKIAAVLNDYLTDSGYRTQQIDNGANAVDFMRTNGADLMLLDLMLPGLDGIGVCKVVREFSTLPIIMLTARIDEVDRLMGLEVGADDYVCKPFSPREVVARVKAQLRRAGVMQPASKSSSAGIVVEREQLRVLVDGTPLALTPVEFRLLAEMIAHPERVYSRQQLLDLAHEDQRDINDRTIDTHIKNIRRKLNQLLPDADYLQSVYGVGYRFAFPA